MWIGRGFDTDGDGDNDIFVAQQITPEQQKATAQAMGVIIVVVLICAGLFGAAYAILNAVEWGTKWWSSNSAVVASWAAHLAIWSLLGLGVVLAVGTMCAVFMDKQRRSTTTRAESNDSVSVGSKKPSKKGATKPCRMCGVPVTESHVNCPKCKVSCPFPS